MKAVIIQSESEYISDRIQWECAVITNMWHVERFVFHLHDVCDPQRSQNRPW